MLASRHGVGHSHTLRRPDDFYLSGDRAAPALEEVVVVVRSAAFEADDLAQFTRALRYAHVTWGDATVLPYPLHEASRLAGHLK